MSKKQPYGNFQGTYPGAGQAGYQWPPQGGYGPAGWAGPQGFAPNYGPGYGPGPGPGPGPQAAPNRRIDALDVLEGVLQDGLSLSNLTRIARASGSNFWVGAAIGAGLVVLVNRQDVREGIAKVFSGGSHAPEPPRPQPAAPEPAAPQAAPASLPRANGA